MNIDSRPQSIGEGGLEMFRNRLTKNKKEISKWAIRNGIDCFRIYDKDVPQVPVAIDSYSGHIVLHYFRGPYDETDEIMDERIGRILTIIKEVLNLSNNVYVKLREKKKGKSQYEKLSQDHIDIIAKEDKAKFKINLSDYLDVGLFLDHRPLRMRVAEESKNLDVLNLFCYTGSFSVHSALNGSSSTTSIDLSNVYINWAEDNLRLNGLNLRDNVLIADDVLSWIRRESLNQHRKQYDLIVLDPPTFSNSKRTDEIFDLQKDHTELIKVLVQKFLTKSGILYFSTNFRKFKMDESILNQFEVLDISASTIPRDFRDQKIHYTWRISKKI
ncbi:class I SAM-dependent methyltransferase [Leptospira sp. GIMC2001]|uniref:class I SAM-dependent methyltransferase n=1 Tax=Leptospira sp. GIMC2001 TaxID=1513297 RepID=UPI00234A51B4|nr:class I SAM-dependent methyltransferase [Leptospira sp. GIMC2001]WCL49954.1 class I SAM-dependent methyltransferase [Leptospira sp. GIMC2001]